MTIRSIPTAPLATSVERALRTHGADAPSTSAAVRAMMHASRLGVDSHGVRLTPHYCAALRGGRLKGTPLVRFERTGAAAGMVDADDGLGHGAAYEAVARACALAQETGIGAVGVRRSSHIGAAGAYALAGAEAGCVTLFFTNSDSGVLPHDGQRPFHGTNPIAAAAPAAGSQPWLLDMATSSIPFNRILLYRVLGLDLPADVAVDAEGHPTTEAGAAAALVPLGGAGFGHKGAGLAGLVAIFSALLTGAVMDDEIAPMVGGPLDRPRGLGQFALAIAPAFFGGRASFEAELARYMDRLRAAPAAAGATIMAPGDREWRVAAEREANGIPVDPETAAFLGV